MEKTASANGSHGASSDAGEVFFIHEPATGKSTLLRKATDEQLAKAFAQAQQENNAIVNQITQLSLKLSGISGMCGAMAYEIDTRKRAGIVIVHGNSMHKSII